MPDSLTPPDLLPAEQGEITSHPSTPTTVEALVESASALAPLVALEPTSAVKHFRVPRTARKRKHGEAFVFNVFGNGGNTAARVATHHLPTMEVIVFPQEAEISREEALAGLVDVRPPSRTGSITYFPTSGTTAGGGGGGLFVSLTPSPEATRERMLRPSAPAVPATAKKRKRHRKERRSCEGRHVERAELSHDAALEESVAVCKTRKTRMRVLGVLGMNMM